MAGTVFFSVGLVMDFRGLKQCYANKILFRLLFLWLRPLPSISQKLIAERLFEINYIRPDILQLTDISDIHFSNFNFGSRYGSCSGSAAPINFGSTGYASTTLVLRIKIYKMDKNVFLI